MGDVVKTIGEVAGVVAPVLTGGAAAALDPILYGTAAAGQLIGANDAQNAQKAQQQQRNASLGQAQDLARQLAQGPNLQALIDAERSGVNTLQSTMGGVANPGALIMSLFGKNIENALGAALGQRSGDLQAAMNGVLATGQQYSQGAQQAGSAAGGLAAGLGPIIAGYGASRQKNNPGGVVTGPGSTTTTVGAPDYTGADLGGGWGSGTGASSEIGDNGYPVWGGP